MTNNYQVSSSQQSVVGREQSDAKSDMQPHTATCRLLAADSHSRRYFLANTGKIALLASMGMFGVGCEAVNQGLFGRGMMPIALDDLQAVGLPKTDMLVHTENPSNGEFTPHLLNDDVTPTERHFVRNNSGIPKRAIEKDRNGWKLVIDGEVHKELTLSMDDLQRFHRSLMKLYWNVRGMEGVCLCQR